MEIKFIIATFTEERLLVFGFSLETTPLIDGTLLDAHLFLKQSTEAVHFIEELPDVLRHHLMDEFEDLLIFPSHVRQH